MSSARARSRSHVRLLYCLLSYALLLTLPSPPSSAAAESGPAVTGAGKSAGGAAALTKQQADAPRREGELLVRFGPDVTEQGKESVVLTKGARRKGRLRGESRLERLELQAGQDPAAVAEQLRGEPGVELAEPNFIVTRDQVTANDPRLGDQWALRNTGQSGGVGSDVGVASAWGTTTGSPSAVVPVLNSGTDFTHPDLRDNRWVNAGETENGRDDDRNGFADDLHGWDWVAGSDRVVDENGHGTAVARIVAA